MVCIISTICVNKPTDLRIVITAGYIVESRLLVVVITTIADGIKSAEAEVGEVNHRNDVAPRIVLIRNDLSARAIVKTNNVTLGVGVRIIDIIGVIGGANVTNSGEMAVRIVVIEELIFSAFFVDNLISVIEIFVLDTIDGFRRTQTVGVVRIVNVQAFVIN